MISRVSANKSRGREGVDPPTPLTTTPPGCLAHLGTRDYPPPTGLNAAGGVGRDSQTSNMFIFSSLRMLFRFLDTVCIFFAFPCIPSIVLAG